MTAKLLYPEYIDSKVQGVKLLIHHTPMLYNRCIKPQSLYTYLQMMKSLSQYTVIWLLEVSNSLMYSHSKIMTFCLPMKCFKLLNTMYVLVLP